MPSYSDLFDRPNGALGADWISPADTNTGQIQIVNNAAAWVAAGGAAVYLPLDSAGDQECEAEFGTATRFQFDLKLRCTTLVGGAPSSYNLRYLVNDQLEIKTRVNGGGSVQRAVAGCASFQVGDRLKFTLVGTMLTGWTNRGNAGWVQVVQWDSASVPIVGSKVGFAIYDPGNISSFSAVSPDPYEGDYTEVDGIAYITFTKNGVLVVAEDIPNAAVLQVGGGGGAGGIIGGGGGAGGYIDSAVAIPAGSHDVFVGAGGLGGYYWPGGQQYGLRGGQSYIFGINPNAAEGGGGGCAWANQDNSNMPGGSGGGGASSQIAGGSITGSPVQGNVGGNGSTENTAGGGGGAGAKGVDQTASASGNGGAGKTWVDGVTRGGGGGAGARVGGPTAGIGGTGGGGNGRIQRDRVPDADGAPNTGGGGGGAGYAGGPGDDGSYRSGGDGGSGVVIVSYALVTLVSPPSISGTVEEGSTLTATPGVWDGNPDIVGEWQYSVDTDLTTGAIAAGATGLTFVIPYETTGMYIRYAERAYVGGVSVGFAASLILGPCAKGPPPKWVPVERPPTIPVSPKWVPLEMAGSPPSVDPSVSDDFNRADGPPGANWIQARPSYSIPPIAGNALSWPQYPSLAWVTPFAPDQEVGAKVGDGILKPSVEFLLRWDEVSGSGYSILASTGGNQAAEAFKWTGGSRVSEGYFSYTMESTDLYIRARIVGGDLTVWGSSDGVFWNLRRTWVVDAGHQAGGGKVGMYNGNNSTFAPIDDFFAGPVASLFDLPPSPYPDVVLADDPNCYWKLDESSGTVMVDSSGNGLDGTYVNPPSFGAPGPLGVGVSSLFVAANLDYATVPDDALVDIGDVFTLEAWVKRAGTGGPGQYIFSKGSQSYGFLIGSSQALTVQRQGVANIAQVDNFTDLNWHHIVWVEDGAVTKIYVDKVERAVVSTPSVVADNSLPLSIGRDNGAVEYLNASVAHLAIYPVALSQVQVSAHYDAMIVSPPPNWIPLEAGFLALKAVSPVSFTGQPVPGGTLTRVPAVWQRADSVLVEWLLDGFLVQTGGNTYPVPDQVGATMTLRETAVGTGTVAESSHSQVIA